MKDAVRTIIISRTDAIGDVVLTLPLAELIKQFLGKETRVIFFGRTYTYPVINCCTSVDKFINYDTFKNFDEEGRINFLKELNADAIIHVFPRKDIASAAKSAGIKQRIGTTNRLFHWNTCDNLVRLGRRNSSLHEAQLNIKLLKPLGFKEIIPLKDIPALYHLNNFPEKDKYISGLLSTDKFTLIIHPKSNASGREWKLSNYRDLIRFLPPQKFQFIITGGINEKELIDEWMKELPQGVLNLAGKLSLEQLISVIHSCDGLIASGTGPLHLAAAMGKYTLGIFPPIKPVDPQRWAPIGVHAEYIVAQKNCSDCRNNPAACHCINEVSPEMAAERVRGWVG